MCEGSQLKMSGVLMPLIAGGVRGPGIGGVDGGGPGGVRGEGVEGGAPGGVLGIILKIAGCIYIASSESSPSGVRG